MTKINKTKIKNQVYMHSQTALRHGLLGAYFKIPMETQKPLKIRVHEIAIFMTEKLMQGFKTDKKTIAKSIKQGLIKPVKV